MSNFITTASNKIIIALIFSLLLLLVPTSLFSQFVPGKDIPWPPLWGWKGGSFPAKQSNIKTPKQSLYTAGMNVDSTTFTPVVVPFPAVIAGDASWIDYDNDGYLDVVITGSQDDGTNLTRIFHNNNGTSFTDINANILPIGGQHATSWGDYDNDGDFDLAIAGRLDTLSFQNVTKIYRNDNGTFVDINAPLMGLYGGVMQWVDYNNDGKPDILLTGSPDAGQTFYAILYRNDDSTFTDVQAGLEGSWATAASWGDYDNDGDLDLLMCGYGSNGAFTKIYRNDNGTFVDIHADIVPVNSGACQWVDIDNDGDLDIVLSGVMPGNIPITKIYRNDGNGVFTDINASIEPFLVSAIAIGDYDNDGYLDIAISGADDFITGNNPRTKIYHNDHGSFSDIGAVLVGTWFGSLSWGDYNNDGKLDLLVTGATIPRATWFGPFAPTTVLYQNNYQVANTKPSAPVITPTVINGTTAQLNWNTAVDGQTPTNELTYNIRVGSSPGRADIIAPSSNLATGFRRVPALGNSFKKTNRLLKNLPNGKYYWSVQTVDNQYTGSAFGTEQYFVIGKLPPRPLGISGLSTNPTLRWNSVSDVVSYHLQLSTSESFTSGIIVDDSTLTDTSSVVGPLLSNQTYYWRVTALTSSSGQLGWSDVLSFDARDGEITSNLSISENWNLISLPLMVADNRVGSLFPNAAGAYSYSSTGYNPEDNLKNGHGYWLRNPVEQVAILTGVQVLAETVDVATDGWTLIGGISTPVQTDKITSDPAGLLTSPFFGYNGGYFQSTTLQPGSGYWVKTGGMGKLILSVNPGPGSNRIHIVAITDRPPAPPTDGEIIGNKTKPSTFALSQNYPNPFNPTTTIRCGLPSASRVHLKIYDMVGRLVATLVDGEMMDAGYHDFVWKGANCSGIYFYRFEASGVSDPRRTFTRTGKMIMLK
jgi:hypothetical protein